MVKIDNCVPSTRIDNFVWSIDGPLGNWTETGDQPSGKVVLVRSARQAKETTSTESEQPEEDTQGCSG